MINFYIVFTHSCIGLDYYLYKFNNGHFGVVSLTGDGSQNTAVSSVAVGISVRGGLEKRVNKLFVVHPGHGLASGVQVSTLSEFDHVVDVFSNGAGTDKGRLDASVSDSFCGKGSEEGLSLISGLSKLLESLAVGNHVQLGAGVDLLGKADGASSKRSAGGCRDRKEKDVLESRFVGQLQQEYFGWKRCALLATTAILSAVSS